MQNSKDHIEKPVVIFGAGAHGRVIAELLIGKRLTGFADQNPLKRTVAGHPILGNDESVLANLQGYYIMGLGWQYMKQRSELIKTAEGKGWIPYEPAIAYSAIVDSKASVGGGTTVFPGVIINPNAHISNNCVLNTGCIIEHDVYIGDNTFIAPGVVIGGSTRIGSNTMIGIGATILNEIKIGNEVFVKAGLTVTHDLSDRSVVGPSKIL
jgi:sugar O-acyltransferase (sialic acid O-acetyltransferase NeuD family)